ncbi:glycoside hydrolase family 92 protein [Rugamonas sp. A1-17]|nr:glycoside hydrolase family 92 protein [Rugamonas sp. A1-17]
MFSALGIYPSTPGSGRFLLHEPKFAGARIELRNGRQLRIEKDAPAAGAEQTAFIRQVDWNARPHDKVCGGLGTIAARRPAAHAPVRRPGHRTLGQQPGQRPARSAMRAKEGRNI